MQFKKLQIHPKYLKLGAWIGGILLLLLIIGGLIAFSKREALLKSAISKAIAKAKNDYGLKVAIGKAGFSGLATVKFQQISVVPENRDTLASIQNLSVGVKLFPLIFGDVKLAEVNMNDGIFSAVFKDTVSNLDFFLKRKKKDSVVSNVKVDLSEIAHNLLNQILYKIPDDMEVKNMVFKLNDNDTAALKFDFKNVIIDNGKLSSTILVNNGYATWHMNGKLNPGSQKLEIALFADNKPVELPYLNNKINGKISFDTVYTKMNDAGYKNSNFVISGSWAVKNLLINQHRLTTTDIILPDARLEAEMFVGENFIGLDSNSTIHLNKAVFNPYVKYTLSPSKVYELKFKVKEQEAQDVLNSFPVGLFETLDGMKVAGKIKYDFDFYLDGQQPDSVRFSSSLTPINFKILSWGKTDLQFLNKDFVYTPYEYGKPMRNITIGRSNPNYTPIDLVSSNFKNAVLTAEDPSFFRHNGFVEEAIRASIVTNYKEKGFKRGGSTISMQLVKNAFLNRHKTLSRKAEEILIVWLIEHNKLISKQRMLEVYVNIIEMGYNVYGIGEAARHYFGKSAAELTTGEGIFLASIVPRPKASLYKFNSDGSLKPYMFNYFNSLGNLMARRGLIEADSTGYGFYDVRAKEGIRHLLPKSTAALDTADVEDDNDLLPLLMQDKSKSLFDRLFPARKDTLVVQPAKKEDTVKTRRQIRQENRQQRRNGN